MRISTGVKRALPKGKFNVTPVEVAKPEPKVMARSLDGLRAWWANHSPEAPGLNPGMAREFSDAQSYFPALCAAEIRSDLHVPTVPEGWSREQYLYGIALSLKLKRLRPNCIVATSNKQVDVEKLLDELGFQRIHQFTNQNTLHLITLWIASLL